MVQISYPFMLAVISIGWLVCRGFIWIRQHCIEIKRELVLLLVYICLIVISRFTFFPFSKLNGSIQPLVWDASRMFPPRVNLLPLVHLLDYPSLRDVLLNLIGNTAMFIPVGIVWPTVFKKLNTPSKAISAGVGYALCIEPCQLPFFDRVSDIDDLLLNSAGFLIGYGVFSFIKRISKKGRNNRTAV